MGWFGKDWDGFGKDWGGFCKVWAGFSKLEIALRLLYAVSDRVWLSILDLAWDIAMPWASLGWGVVGGEGDGVVEWGGDTMVSKVIDLHISHEFPNVSSLFQDLSRATDTLHE